MRSSVCVLLLVITNLSAAVADERENFFETKIRPVLVGKCLKCHGGDKVSGNLRVDALDALKKGGDTGPSLVAGKPDDSLLMKAIGYQDDDLKMPPDKPLPPEVVADFRRWIEAGAVWPQTKGGALQAERHWAFRPIARPALPTTRRSDWSLNPVDQFVLAKQEAAGLSPSPRADRATLLRRVKADLLGLPPTYDEVRDFVSDPTPDAYERLVDRYLDSPHYGERWGRHWLDVARYADTKGYVFQEERKYPFAFTYRDWVIRSLNADLPYDAFLERQLAADHLVKDGLDQSELAAMGFLTLGRRFLNNVHDIIDDRLDVTFRGTMGLTIGCARCHDHKYDPIPTTDYYALHGVFASSMEPKDAQNSMPLFDQDKPHDSRVLLRGQPGNPGPIAKRQFLEVVAGPDRKPFEKGSGRREMAQAIISPTNPLTARVMANRVWREHFDSPLVRSPSDFGLRCDPPTHPELLDYLAARLISSGWSLKALHRELLLSATYQQTSTDDPAKRAVDSENRLLWRMNRGRLNLEAMRDSVMAASGSLLPQLGGPAIDITAAEAPRRRTVYGFIDRQNLPGFFRTFDFASPDAHSPGRFETSVPQQTLYLRNNAFVRAEAKRLTSRLPDGSAEDRVRELYRAILARDPQPDEAPLAVAFVTSTETQGDNRQPWSHGYGALDETTGKLRMYQRLPHFTGKSWQGGPTLPDAQIGWAMWHQNGGHPGDADHSAVLRWTAPESMKVAISGELWHPSKEGDGVRATVTTKQGRVASWTAFNQRVATPVTEISVEAGDTIDFVVDCRSNTNNDSFNWAPTIAERSPSNRRWVISQEFKGPAEAGLDAWSQLAQVLLLSNEFQFVD